jgi:hypothetical protein
MVGEEVGITSIHGITRGIIPGTIPGIMVLVGMVVSIIHGYGQVMTMGLSLVSVLLSVATITLEEVS